MRNEQGRREIHTVYWWRNLRERHWWSWQDNIEIGPKKMNKMAGMGYMKLEVGTSGRLM
jgi:hypothetical protein